MAAPVSAILFKCRVTKTDIPYGSGCWAWQVKLDENEYTDIFIPCVYAKICNWSYKLITEKELDFFLKEKNLPAQQHWKQYKNAMINSKDDNIGTAIIGKAMEYFGIKE